MLTDYSGTLHCYANRLFRYFTLLYCQTIEVLRITMLSDNSGTLHYYANRLFRYFTLMC